MKKITVKISMIIISIFIIEIFFKTIHIQPQYYSPEKNTDSIILCAGDSFTIGYGVSEDKNYPSILQSILKTNNKPGKVINIGENGANSRKVLLNLKAFLRENTADIAIIQAGSSNNWNLNYYSEDEIGLKNSLLGRSSIINFFKIIFQNHKKKEIKIIIPQKASENNLKDPFEYADENIEEFIKNSDWNELSKKLENSHYPDIHHHFIHFFSYYENNEIQKAENLIKKDDFPEEYISLCSGLLNIYRSDFKTALNDIQRFSSIQPDNVFSYLSFAYIYLNTQNHDIAEIWLKELIKLKSDCGIAYQLLGEIYYNLSSNRAKAVEILQKGILKAPEYYDNYVFLYDICEKYSPETAMPFIKKATQIFPENKELFYYETILYNNIKKREVFLDKLKDNDITDEEKAYFYLNSFQYDKAAYFFEKAGIRNQERLSLDLSKNTDSSTLYEYLIYKDISDCISILKEKNIRTFILGYPEQKIYQLEKAASDNNIYFIDLFKDFINFRNDIKIREKYILPDNHCTELGNSLTAKKVYEAIKNDL